MGVNYTAAQVDKAIVYPEGMFWSREGAEFILNIDGENVTAVLSHRHDTEDDWSGRVFFVLKIGDQYFRRWGTYRSHYGYEWDYGDTEEVFPKVVETLVFEA